MTQYQLPKRKAQFRKVRTTGQEKGKHPVRGSSDKRKSRDDVFRQGNLNLQVSIYISDK